MRKSRQRKPPGAGPSKLTEPDLLPPGLQCRATDFYSLSPGGDAITCRRCGFTSRDPRHIQEKYCPNCRAFHEDRILMVRLSEGLETELPVQAQEPVRLAA